MPKNTIQLLLLEHQALAREGLRLLVDREKDMQVRVAAADVAQVTDGTAPEYVDIALVNMDSAHCDFPAVVKTLRALFRGVRIVALCDRWCDELIARALAEDTEGVVLKDESFANLCAAIRQVHGGRRWYSRRAEQRLVSTGGDGDQPDGLKTRLNLLTQRELQLLRLLASGLSLKAACAAMKVTYKTGDKHKVNLMRKLDIHDRVELARYAIREGLVEP